jgi:hypothetical protein
VTPTAKVLLGFLIAALVVFAWMFRIDARPTTPVGVAIVTDRWTGTVVLCSAASFDNCAQIYPPRPRPSPPSN